MKTGKNTKAKEATRIEMADFETTVFQGQQYTEVWAAATVTLGTENVHVFHSIDELFDYYCEQNESMVIYFHNLKFDGHFILYYLREVLHFKQAEDYLHNDIEQDDFSFVKKWKMPEKSYQYLISDKGQWYSILVKVNRHYLEFRDSLKLLPFSVRQIGDAFKTKHRKLDMEYEGFRYAGCTITPEEEEYIKNDVLVVKEALEFMFSQGHTRSTIGSCCMAEFKATQIDYDLYFPNLYEIPIDESYGTKTAGDYILKSYRGGWCYLDKRRTGKILRYGTTADVNSLYPSMMHSMSGNVYPVGQPEFWKGEMPELPKDCYYFIRIRTRFYLKKGKLPMKGTFLYRGTECLETSDVYYKGKYHRFIYDEDGNRIPTTVILTMTCSDYKLFLEHYDVEDFEVLDGCYFRSMSGIFDEYIDKYRKIKMESKGALRTLAKLFLNNLYGKMASNTDSSFKVPYIDPVDNIVRYMGVAENNKKPGYIAVGSAITSYARCFTIRAAQANYHGVHKPGFIYADTDSIHCDLAPSEIKGIRVSDNDFCAWKLESCWDIAKFIRQKTYVEHVTHEDLKPIEHPYYNLKCAGMPESCKDLFLYSMGEKWKDNEHELELSEKQKEKYKDFIKQKRTLNDFKIDLTIPSKLVPRTIKGGVILAETDFTLRAI